MKMIDVFNLMAEGKIKNDTKLIASTVLDTYEYRYSTGYRRFFNKYFNEIEDDFSLDEDFLNTEVELIPPKEKRYLVKINLRWLGGCRKYLSYNEINERVYIRENETLYNRIEFTKDELQSIKSVREFLEDIEGKYELMEVTEDEDY